MGKSAAAKRAGNENSKRSPDEAAHPGPHASAGPAFGDAALRAALNELGAAKPQVSYSPQDISQPAAKTVAQVLGEITLIAAPQDDPARRSRMDGDGAGAAEAVPDF